MDISKNQWRSTGGQCGDCNFSVHGVVELGRHFATLYQELHFYEAKYYFHLQFSKRTGKYFVTFNNYHSEKSSNRAQIYYCDPQPARKKRAISLKCYNS